jgi:hypothetical protein
VDTLEVEETIADAASNGNTLEAMAAAVLVGVGWIRRALEEPVTGVVDGLMGSLPRRTCPPAGGFFVESSAALDFVLPLVTPFVPGMMTVFHLQEVQNPKQQMIPRKNHQPAGMFVEAAIPSSRQRPL